MDITKISFDPMIRAFPNFEWEIIATRLARYKKSDATSRNSSTPDCPQHIERLSENAWTSVLSSRRHAAVAKKKRIRETPRSADQQHVGDDSGATIVTCNADVRDHCVRWRHGHRVATERVFRSAAMSMARARSWPLLNAIGMGSCAASVDDSLLKKNRTETGNDADKSNAVAVQPDGSPQVQARRLLCRHYYPEGGWGWVITVVGTLVHLLGPGLQFSIPATVTLPAKVKFCHHPLHTAGESRSPLSHQAIRLLRVNEGMIGIGIGSVHRREYNEWWMKFNLISLVQMTRKEAYPLQKFHYTHRDRAMQWISKTFRDARYISKNPFFSIQFLYSMRIKQI